MRTLSQSEAATRTCKTCDAALPLSAFPRNGERYYRTECKACCNARGRAARPRNRRPQPPPDASEWTCWKCGTSRPIEAFARKGNARRLVCKPCTNARWRERNATSSSPREPKRCTDCRESEEIVDFPRHSRLCRGCRNAKHRAAYAAARGGVVRIHSRPNGEDSYRRFVLKQYGITLAEYDGMLSAQGGVCAVCRGPQVTSRRFLDVDHCHVTGRVRALLCGTCNSALGAVRDDPALLEQLAAYLARTTPTRR